MTIFGYEPAQIRKAITVLVGCLTALLAHYDVVVGDRVGDTIVVAVLIALTPIVHAIPNKRSGNG